MKYTELVEEVKKLSNKYSFKTFDSPVFGYKIVIYYGNTPALRVYNYQLYHVEVIEEKFSLVPFSNRLWMLANEYAMTPLDERFTENKYNVIIGFNRSNYYPYIVWSKHVDSFEINTVKKPSLKSQNAPSCFQFTNSEFEDLIKYIKHLPDGEFQAKVAEHGKTLVKKGEE